MKKMITIALVAMAGFVVLIGYFLLNDIYNDNIIHAESDVVIQNNDSEDVYELDDDFGIEDERLEAERGKQIGYYDEQGILETPGLMSLNNHITFTNELTAFLTLHDYYTDSITIIKDGANIDKNIGIFYAYLDGMDDIIIKVYSYNNINKFGFELYENNFLILNSKDDVHEELSKKEQHMKAEYEEYLKVSEGSED